LQDRFGAIRRTARLQLKKNGTSFAPNTPNNAGSSNSISNKTLAADQATPYIANFDPATKTRMTISKDKFTEGCKSGWVQAAARSDKPNTPNKPQAMQDKGGDMNSQRSEQNSSD
jgi:hypothetical protein